MRGWLTTLLATLLLVALAGCGSDEPTGAEGGQATVEQQQETTDPGPVSMPREALKTIEEQGADAAGNLQGVSDDELVPSEDGAKLILERGALDEQEFCAAEERVMEAEAGPEAETAFVRGWARNGGAEDMGPALYQALSMDCLDLSG